MPEAQNPTPEGTPGPTPAPAPWHGVTDPEGAAYIQNKGWANPADVVKSYQGAEKLIGRDPNTLLAMPRADDPVGFRAVMSKLGLPETPDKYEFDTPDGLALDKAYMDWARGTFHKLGLPAATAKALTTEHNAYIKGIMEQEVKDYDLTVQTDKAALLKEWGGGHERMMNAAQTAARSLSFTTDMVDAMETAIGYAGTMKFFAQLGQKLGEDKFVGAGSKAPGFGGTMTPDEAKQAWETMKLDTNLRAALQDNQHPGHKSAAEKQRQLFQIMYPER